MQAPTDCTLVAQTTMASQPIAEGVVKIRGMLKQWSSRYIIVRGTTLFIFKDTEKAEWGKAEAEIELAGTCTVVKRKTKKGGHCFKLKHKAGSNASSVLQGDSYNQGRGLLV